MTLVEKGRVPSCAYGEGSRSPPWIDVPDATISFSGTERVIPMSEVEPKLLERILGRMIERHGIMDENCIIEIQPTGHFATLVLETMNRLCGRPGVLERRAAAIPGNHPRSTNRAKLRVTSSQRLVAAEAGCRREQLDKRRP